MSNAANPLNTFTAAEVFARVDAGKLGGTPIRRYFIEVSDGTFIQIPQGHLRSYFAGIWTDSSYVLNTTHVEKIGWELYVSPQAAEAVGDPGTVVETEAGLTDRDLSAVSPPASVQHEIEKPANPWSGEDAGGSAPNAPTGNPDQE